MLGMGVHVGPNNGELVEQLGMGSNGESAEPHTSLL